MKVKAFGGADSFRREDTIRAHLDEASRLVKTMSEREANPVPEEKRCGKAEERAAIEREKRLKLALEEWSGHLVQTSVGDRYVLEAMQDGDFSIGGESSGHMIFMDISPSGDGLAAALKVIEAMIETGQPLSRLKTCLRRLPQCVRALTVGTQPPLESLPGLGEAVAQGERDLGGKGRILLRYSGTEPKIRLLVEGPDPAGTEAVMARLEQAVRKELEVKG
jgi:phosphoglucosamine mutase